ncbi:nucleotidyltransferase domain-containing protein [Lysinibacillus agricola]|uniref:nucleotidyltransferase domain-containing protein n=1 Tax=Lysinibacillus agricola TaxID=2590012 RepID=UPI003C1E872A
MTQEIFDARTVSQLKVLSEISAITERLEIEFWLRGGWAIDFLLGKITRSHEDIDLTSFSVR